MMIDKIENACEAENPLPTLVQNKVPAITRMGARDTVNCPIKDYNKFPFVFSGKPTCGIHCDDHTPIALGVIQFNDSKMLNVVENPRAQSHHLDALELC